VREPEAILDILAKVSAKAAGGERALRGPRAKGNPVISTDARAGRARCSFT
jgi:hypothetical protein